MTSKTFKSVNADAKKDLLVVLEVDEGVNIHIESPVDRRGVSVAPTDAPALALAILEAAGYGEEIVTDGSPDGHIQVAKYYLYEGVKAHASITAEARERAELEAEALELLNAHRKAERFDYSAEWDDLNNETKNKWLAVARRAREMRAEK